MELDQNQREQLDGLVDFVQVPPNPQRDNPFMERLASDDEENIEHRMNREILPHNSSFDGIVFSYFIIPSYSGTIHLRLVRKISITRFAG